MGSGIDAARTVAPEHAALMENFRDQLLIVLVKRLLKMTCKDRLRIPVAETDDTGGDLLLVAVRDGDFVFEVVVARIALGVVGLAGALRPVELLAHHEV